MNKQNTYYILTLRKSHRGTFSVIANKMDATTHKRISNQAIEKNIEDQTEAENRIFVLERTTFKHKLKK